MAPAVAAAASVSAVGAVAAVVAVGPDDVGCGGGGGVSPPTQSLPQHIEGPEPYTRLRPVKPPASLVKQTWSNIGQKFLLHYNIN
jgi:hypothetical protein